jgi:hypothetical protein
MRIEVESIIRSSTHGTDIKKKLKDVVCTIDNCLLIHVRQYPYADIFKTFLLRRLRLPQDAFREMFVTLLAATRNSELGRFDRTHAERSLIAHMQRGV